MTDEVLRDWGQDDPELSRAAVVERAIGVLVLALREAPEVVAGALEGTAWRHEVSLHDLAEAVLTAAQGRRVPAPLLRKILWEEWGDLLS